MQRPANSESQPPQFEDLAQKRRSGMLYEIWDFVLNNKKWWLTPIILVLLLAGLVVVLGSTAAAPFIYTLF